jgi:hypothetical protein
LEVSGNRITSVKAARIPYERKNNTLLLLEALKLKLETRIVIIKNINNNINHKYFVNSQ